LKKRAEEESDLVSSWCGCWKFNRSEILDLTFIKKNLVGNEKSFYLKLNVRGKNNLEKLKLIFLWPSWNYWWFFKNILSCLFTLAHPSKSTIFL
jgi:hypothetical protein